MEELKNNNEKELIAAAKQGDRNAFTQLYTLNLDVIYRLSYHYTANPADASDLAQEVFVKAYTSLNSFKGTSDFSTWLYRITANLWKDMLKHKRRLRFFSLDNKIKTEEGDLLPLEIESKELSAENIAEDKELKSMLQEGLAVLPPDQRELVIAKYLENKSYEEIAKIYDYPLGTVCSRVTRGVKIMKEYFRKNKK